MRVGKIGIAVIGLVPFNVYGECTPAPDCDAIGYTETSCEGAFIKCPFDTSKLFCVPCDSSFKYDCSGDNITGGTGSTCGGKYVSCECLVGGKFNNGMCVCDAACTVGAIYYSDGSCSTCVIPSKTAIGIVVKDNELVMSNNLGNISWGDAGKDISGLANKSLLAAQNDYAGIANTATLVSKQTAAGLTSSNSAAIYCNEYYTAGTNANDWYLPATGELYEYVYGNYSDLYNTWVNVLTLDTEFYHIFWSSTEESRFNAWSVYSNDGNIISDYKGGGGSVTCFLSIN